MKLTICTTCQAPHRGEFCDNPACSANPTIPESTKQMWNDRAAKERAQQAEWAMLRRAYAMSFGSRNG